jgi:hypothetical protein
MLSEIRTGSITTTDGAVNPARSDKTGALVVTDAHGRYTEAVLRGNIFIASNSATQALSTNSTTATGLILTNPAGSTKNLALLRISVALASLPAGQSTLILTGNTNPIATAVTHTTPLTIQSALLGSQNKSSGLADSAATIPNATIIRVIPAGTAATVASSTAFPPMIDIDLGGEIILTPGTCISLQALTTAITVVASISWEEISI